MLALRPTPQAEGPPLIGCPRQLIQFIHSYPPYQRPFLYPQPEDEPCRRDKSLRCHKLTSASILNIRPHCHRNSRPLGPRLSPQGPTSVCNVTPRGINKLRLLKQKKQTNIQHSGRTSKQERRVVSIMNFVTEFRTPCDTNRAFSRITKQTEMHMNFWSVVHLDITQNYRTQ